MAQSVTCTKVTVTGGRAYINFGKRQLEFKSRAEARQWALDQLSANVADALLLLKWFENDPTGSNPALLEGRTVTLDFAQATNIVRVT